SDRHLGRLAEQGTVPLANGEDFLLKELPDLLRSATGEAFVVERFGPFQGGESGIAFEAVEQIISGRAGLERGRDFVAMLADAFVQNLAIAAASYTFHKYIFCCHVRQHAGDVSRNYFSVYDK